MKITNKIKLLRVEKNITQDDLAKAVTVRRETILFLEQGKYVPSLELAYKVAKYFSKSIEEIFTFTSD